MNRHAPLPVILCCLALASCKGTEGNIFLGLGADSGSGQDAGAGAGQDGGFDFDSATAHDGSLDFDGSSPPGDGGFDFDSSFPPDDGGALPDGSFPPDDGGPTLDGGGDDGGIPNVDCTQNPPVFPSFDRSCATAADCVLGTVQINCCGSLTVTGINELEEARFASAAATCASQFPACGCPTQPTVADDGTTEVNSGPAIVQCLANTCQSTFPPTPTACGNLSCDPATDVCVTTGPLGPGFQYACVAIPSGCEQDRTCSCPGVTLCNPPFDTCSETGPNQILCECLLCA